MNVRHLDQYILESGTTLLVSWRKGMLPDLPAHAIPRNETLNLPQTLTVDRTPNKHPLRQHGSSLNSMKAASQDDCFSHWRK